MSANDADMVISSTFQQAHPELSEAKSAERVRIVQADARLLARCAKSACLITYTSAIELRGHGNVQSGHWLDDVYEYALKPLDLPDLTLLVVNKITGKPSEGAFHDGRMKLSGIRPEDVKAEQRRAAAFSGYGELFGHLEAIPDGHKQSVIVSSQRIEQERGIMRAVGNAVARIEAAGTEKQRIAKEYIGSLPADKLRSLARRLMDKQNGRCALTNTPFDEASEVDRVSLDRIDNERGYAEGNVHLTTVFANRARGTLPVQEARQRLVQWVDKM